MAVVSSFFITILLIAFEGVQPAPKGTRTRPPGFKRTGSEERSDVNEMLTEQNRRMNAAGKKEECSEQTQNIRPVFVRDTASQPKWNG
jgi:hypothetical protein